MKSVFSFCSMLFLFFSASFAQQLTNNNPIKTIYYYSFNAVMDASIIDEMEKEVQLLTSVIEVKIKYKPENKTAQLIVLVKERRRNSEGDLLFQPTDLKHIISAHGFLPNELTTEVLLD